MGLRPRPDNVVEVNPLIPEGTWDYFCLDNVPYHGRVMAILYDKTGERYGKGKGLRVFADGHLIAISESLQRVRGTLPFFVSEYGGINNQRDIPADIVVIDGK